MSVNQTVNSSGLIFCFDTNNIKSFLGKPATNIITGITSWNGTVDTANYKILDSVEKVYIPGLKKYYDCRYVQIYNNDSANYCCPSLLQYGWPATAVTGNTLYTYSIIYKCTSHYSNSNYMYHYEYGPSGYITEYGVFDTSKRTDLGGGWYHAWNTFTTNVNCNNIYCGSWYYQYGVYDRFYVAAANIVAGNYLLSPLQMLEPNQTRSNTQGLLDLTGNATLNLSSTSFDSTGTPTFNGTSSYIYVTPSVAFTLYNLDVWIYNNNAIPNNDTVIGGPSTYQTIIQFNEAYPTGINLGAWTSGMTNESVHFWTGTASSYGATYIRDYVAVGWHNLVFNWNGSGYDIWVDGTKRTTYSFNGGLGAAPLQTNVTNMQVGYSSPGYYFNGKIPIVKCYNTQLTDTQVLQNFNATKGRFGL